MKCLFLVVIYGGVIGRGSASLAYKIFGAKWGLGVGFHGKSYALPTKDYNIDTLPISKIKKYVDDLLEFVINNDDKRFIITKVGCGLAGLTIDEVAPLFKEFLEIRNCTLPMEFIVHNMINNN